MASWKEERDRLVAQTLAFVQQVAAAHPATASKLGLAPPGGSPAGTIASSAADPHVPELPTALPTADIDIAPRDNLTPTNILDDLPKRPVRYAPASERSDIAQRVAAFKARQVTLDRDRAAYYDSVQARIRSSLRNDDGPGRL